MGRADAGDQAPLDLGIQTSRGVPLPLEITQDNPIADKNKTDIPVVYRMIDGKAIVTAVSIGPSDLTHTLIKAGLAEGDVVIVGPYKILEGLQHDTPVTEEKPKTDETEKTNGEEKTENAETNV